MCVWFPRSATTINTRRRRQRASAQTESRCPPEFLFDILPSSGFARPVTVTGAVLDFSAEEHPATASAVEETKKKKKREREKGKKKEKQKKKGNPRATTHSLVQLQIAKRKKKYITGRVLPPPTFSQRPHTTLTTVSSIFARWTSARFLRDRLLLTVKTGRANVASNR